MTCIRWCCLSLVMIAAGGCGDSGNQVGMDAHVADLADLAVPDDQGGAGDQATGPIDPCLLTASGNGLSVVGATAVASNVQYVSTPALGVTFVRAASTFDVYFSVPIDQAEASKAANYTIVPPLAVTSVAVQAQQATLTIAPPVPDKDYTLTVSNIHNQGDTVLFAPVSLPFRGYRFHMNPSAVAAKQVGIFFYDSTVPCTEAQKTSNYTIPGYTVVNVAASGCGMRTQYVTLTLDAGLSPGPHSLTASATLTDTLGNPLGPLTTVFAGPGNPAPLYVQSEAVSGSNVALTFNTDVDPTTGAVAGNYTLSPALTIGAPSIGSGLNGNQVTLPITTVANTLYTLNTSGVLSKGVATAPAIPAYSFYGNGSFYPTSVLALSPTQVRIYFSQNVGASAGVLANYAVSGGATVQSVAANNLAAVLTLSGSQPSTDYKVTLSGLSSMSGVPLATGYSGLVDVTMNAAVDQAAVPEVYLGSVDVNHELGVGPTTNGLHLLVNTGLLASGSYQLKLCGLRDAAHTTVLGPTLVGFTVP